MGKRILVVEDDESARLLYEEELNEEGYAVFFANDGFLALKFLEKENVDLVMTDIRMPGINGAIMISLIRSKYPNIRIVVVSACKQTSEEGVGKNVDRYFEKPVNLKSLKQYIAELLGN
jgi:CheY-like chemotaxis protein